MNVMPFLMKLYMSFYCFYGKERTPVEMGIIRVQFMYNVYFA